MGKNNKTLKIFGLVAAIVIALIAVLTYTSGQVGTVSSHINSVDIRLSAEITEAARVERDHYGSVMNRLMEQSQDIGEIKGTLGRIEDKLNGRD